MSRSCVKRKSAKLRVRKKKPMLATVMT